MIRTFLSYSTDDDLNFISKTANELKKNKNFKLWYFGDCMNHYSSPNNVFIEKLDCSDLFVVFFSNNSLDSIFVEEEVLRAKYLIRKNKLIGFLPLLIDLSLTCTHQEKLKSFEIPFQIHYTPCPVFASKIITKYCDLNFHDLLENPYI